MVVFRKILKVMICIMLFSYCCFGFAQSVSDFVAEFNVSHYNFENKYLNNYVTLEVKRFSNIYLDKNPSIAIINNSGCKIKAFFDNKQNLKHYLSRVDYSRDITLSGKLNKIQNTNKGVVFLLKDCDVSEYDSSNDFEVNRPFDIQQYLRDVAYIEKWGNDEKARELKNKYFYYDKVMFNGTINQISNESGEYIVYVNSPDFGELEFHLCKGYYDNFTIDDLKGAFLGHPIDIFGHILFNNGKIFWRDIRDCRFDISYSELEQVVNDIKNEKTEKALQEELQRMQAEEKEKLQRIQMEEKRKLEEEKQKLEEEKQKWFTVGETVKFGHYGGEEIEWLVLRVEDGQAFLLSKYGLDAKPYHTTKTSVTWETCSLRHWLNNDFYNEAFSTEEQQKIVTTFVKAHQNPRYKTPPGNDTEDKVFLLSIQAANHYFQDVEARKCKATEYAKKNGALVSTIDGCANWWLRSPGEKKNCAAEVDFGIGFVHDSGSYVNYNVFVVRPVICVRVK